MTKTQANILISFVSIIGVGWISWVSFGIIDSKVTAVQVANVATSVDEIKKDIRELVLPRLGVNPAVINFIGTSTVPMVRL